MIIYLYNSLDCLKAIYIAILYTKFAYELLELKKKKNKKQISILKQSVTVDVTEREADDMEIPCSRQH